jgi:DNA-binding CsgD family transcriptional regulator
VPPERSNGHCENGPLYLAPRYRRVIELLSQGKTPREVADILGLKPATAWSYMEEIFLKQPQLRHRLALVVLELTRGLEGCVR